MLRLSSVAAVVVLSVSQVVAGQVPFVENLYVPQTSNFELSGPFDWTDIPETVKVVSIPAGTAFLSWSLAASAGTNFRIRPVIGDAMPAEGKLVSNNHSVGSWVGTVTDGTVPVKLQVSAFQAGQFHTTPSWGSVSWSLIIFPRTTGNVPAVSTWGLTMLGLLVLTGGTVAILRRKAAVV